MYFGKRRKKFNNYSFIVAFVNNTRNTNVTPNNMKKIIYLLPVLVALVSGCLKNQDNVPSPDPSGTFTGEFRRISKAADQSIDTLKANIKVVIQPGIGYHVLGDTTTVHAGSKGHYGINGNGIMFVDDTYSATSASTKTHLNGEYLFIYNGSVFQMVRNSGDTLSLQYDLKKTN
jgi:hypothetical protein